MSDRWQLAQINIATALYDEDDPRIREFYEQLDTINALAEQSPGFVWRLQSESGNATDITVDDDPSIIVNMSVWESVEALFEFAYKTAHTQVLAKRRSWFARPQGAYQAMWWIPAGYIPSVEEAMQKIELVRENGPSRDAFTFKTKYPPPGVDGNVEDLEPEEFCSGWN